MRLNIGKTAGPRSNRYNQILIFLIMLTVNVGFGIIMPILPYYAENMGATATHLGLLTGMYAGMQFLFAPIWGRLSDRVGRKPVMLLGMFGFTITFIGFGLSTELWMLFLARGISGFITSATLPTVMAYIADTTDPDNRAGGMSLLGSAMGLGTIIGPMIGGFLGEFSPATPFFFAAALALGIAFFALFFLPESLTEETRVMAREAGRPKAAFLDVFRMLSAPIGFLFILAFLTSFGMAQMEGTSALFYESKFGAGSREMGIIFMVMGAVSFLTQFVLVGRAIRRLGEQKTLTLTLIGLCAALMTFSFVDNLSTAIMAVILVGFFSSFFRPSLNTMVSNRTLASEQGAVMGVINSYYSLGRMLGPITSGIIFDNLGIHMPFYFAALITLGSVVLAFVFFNRRGLPDIESVPGHAGE